MQSFAHNRRVPASLSAMASAYIRAAHLREDPPPWILEDTRAEQLVGRELEPRLAAMWSALAPDVRAAYRAWFATRARVAEDVAVEMLVEERRDYVILGAGADTFAWRHPRASEFKIWELDQPDTQAWKRSTLAAAGLQEPPNVRFMPVDLATTALGDLALPAKATWNWLGVTMYLERRAVEGTLQGMAACGAGTTAVIEFGLTMRTASDVGRAFQQAAIAAAAAVGEPMFGFYEPAEIEPLLRSSGFRKIELLYASTLSNRYLAGRTDLALPDTVMLAIASI